MWPNDTICPIQAVNILFTYWIMIYDFSIIDAKPSMVYSLSPVCWFKYVSIIDAKPSMVYSLTPVCWFKYVSIIDAKPSMVYSLTSVCWFKYVGPSWSWSYGSWIYNYVCNQCLSPLTLWVRIPFRWDILDTTLCDKICQWLAACQWFSPGTPISSTNTTDRHDVAEILFKVALDTITHLISTFVILPLI